jgi:hypothetical protein
MQRYFLSSNYVDFVCERESAVPAFSSLHVE